MNDVENNENEKHNNNNSIIDILDEPPPSLLDFTKNIIDVNNNKEKLLEGKSKKSLSKISNLSRNSLNKSEKGEQLVNRFQLKETLSIENLNPLIEEIINKNSKKNSNIFPDNRKESILKKESRSLGSTTKDFEDSNENKNKKINNHYSFPHDLKDKIENRNLIINKIENKDIFKKAGNKSERIKEPLPSSDVITDFKRSLSNYTRKKKSTLLSLNDTIDSSTTVKNNVESTKLSPLLNLEDDTLISSLNNNTMVNIEVPNAKNEIENKLHEKSMEDIKMDNLNKEEKKISTLIDEVENLYKSYSPIREINESFKIQKIDEFKEYDKAYDPPKSLTPVESNNNNSYKRLSKFKTCDEIIEDIYRKSKTTEKKVKSEKRSVTATAFNILTSPFTPFSHNDKKSKTVGTTPDKKDTINSSSGGSKKSVSERFKAIWDSTTKGLHYAFSRSLSSDSEEKKINSNNNLNTITSSMNICNSPERDSTISTTFENNTTKFTSPKNDKNLNLKASSSVPSKNKTNFYNSNVEDFNIEYKDTTGISFATAIQSPSESPLAFINSKKTEVDKKINNKILDDNIFKSIIDDSEIKSPYHPSSPLYNKVIPNTVQKTNLKYDIDDNVSHSPSKHLFSNEENDMIIDNKLKKSVSDLTDDSKDTSSCINSSWKNINSNTNSNKEQPSFIPKNTKLKKSNLKKTKGKIKTLESAKLIKKQDELLSLDKKQKFKMNVEKHKVLLQKKKREEEERMANLKSEKHQEMETLIRKRNEKIKQVNEKKKPLKTKEALKRSVLNNNPNLFATTSAIASTIDKFKNSNMLDTTIILKQKNNSSRSSIRKPIIKGGKKSSLSSHLISNTKKSSIPKVKSGKISKLSNLNSVSSNRSSVISTKTNQASASNTSTQNILAGLNNPPSKPIILGLNNLDNSFRREKDNSIISISSSRSSTTPYKGTILQDGEFPDIPSE